MGKHDHYYRKKVKKIIQDRREQLKNAFDDLGWIDSDDSDDSYEEETVSMRKLLFVFFSVLIILIILFLITAILEK